MFLMMGEAMKPMLILLLLVFCTMYLPMSVCQLTVGFYDQLCPSAESVVADVVAAATSSNSRSPAQLLRLHFHDCFVQGCDGSILINNGPNSERSAFSHQGLAGFDVIDQAKERLEAACPGVVSCSDILALAAREAVALSNGPRYQVPTGRRDGFSSDQSMAANMPDVDDSIEALKVKFQNQGLNDQDLVLLSAAHTIGTGACFFMPNRLYNFATTGGSDPSINPAFLQELQQVCPQGGDVNVRLPLDRGSDFTFDNHILQNVRAGFAVLASDAKLYEDQSTRSFVDFYIDGSSFQNDFATAMTRLGQLGALTGSSGEIRRFCSAFNS